MENQIIILSTSERNALFKCLDEIDTKYIIRDRALIRLAYFCALRIGEIPELKLTDVNLKTREIKCNRKQRGISNVIKLTDNEVYKAVADYCKIRSLDLSSPFLFITQQSSKISKMTIHKFFKFYCEKANIDKEKQQFKVLRNTRVVEMIDNQCSIEDIVWWTGLTYTNTSTIYKLYTEKIHQLYTNYNENHLTELYKKLERGNNGSKKENSE